MTVVSGLATMIVAVSLASHAAAQAPVPSAIGNAQRVYIVDLTGGIENRNALYEAIRGRFTVVGDVTDADLAIALVASDGPTVYYDFASAWSRGNYASATGYSVPLTIQYMHLLVYEIAETPVELWRDTEGIGLRPHKTAEKLGERLVAATPRRPTPVGSARDRSGAAPVRFVAKAPVRPPDGAIPVGTLPPITPEVAPPVLLSRSASWTTRTDQRVGFEWSIVVDNENVIPMTAIATVVLNGAGGGVLSTVHETARVPANATHTFAGSGTISSEIAEKAEHWTLDVEWDPRTLFLDDFELVGAGTLGLDEPKLVHKILPDYPDDEAEKSRVEGDVVIEAVIRPDGTVDSPVLLQGVGDDELDARALRAVTQWRFEPARKDGRPVAVAARFRVSYRIRS